MERRAFISKACMICFGAVAGQAILAACATRKSVAVAHELVDGKIRINKSAFEIVSSEKIKKRKFIVVRPDALQFPLAVYATGQHYSALLLQCTHQGCEVTPYETALVCPCHGAEFNPDGNVSQGPAEIPLKEYLVTSDENYIYIQL